MNWRSTALVCGLTLASVVPVHADGAQITVFAASSLAGTFTELGKIYESTHPGVKIIFSFQSSSTLAAQLNAGAPADLFASASGTDMAKVKSRIPLPTTYISNRIVLGVLPNSQISINKIVDLNKKGIKWIQCAHSAPCGAATDRALAVYGKVTSNPVSFEANAASVVSKLLAGEVDAAFIYHTDFVANSSVLKEIRFSDTPSTKTQYSLGVVSDGKIKQQAQEFMKYILSAKSLALLVGAGFTKNVK